MNWTLLTDILQCNPNFHNHPRYDCIIVKDDDGPYFAQLVQVFSCNIGGKDFPLALVQPFTETVSSTTAKLDEDLGFYRVAAKKRDECIFISILLRFICFSYLSASYLILSSALILSYLIFRSATPWSLHVHHTPLTYHILGHRVFALFIF